MQILCSKIEFVLSSNNFNDILEKKKSSLTKWNLVSVAHFEMANGPCRTKSMLISMLCVLKDSNGRVQNNFECFPKGRFFQGVYRWQGSVSS